MRKSASDICASILLVSIKNHLPLKKLEVPALGEVWSSKDLEAKSPNLHRCISFKIQDKIPLMD